jgi:hypothetical protein
MRFEAISKERVEQIKNEFESVIRSLISWYVYKIYFYKQIITILESPSMTAFLHIK